MAQVFDVLYQVRKAKVKPASGAFDVHVYQRDPARAYCLAADASAIAAVLSANVTLGTGETIDILAVRNLKSSGPPIFQ